MIKSWTSNIRDLKINRSTDIYIHFPTDTHRVQFKIKCTHMQSWRPNRCYLKKMAKTRCVWEAPCPPPLPCQKVIKAINFDVTWKCLCLGLCTPNANSSPCFHQKLQASFKVCSLMQKPETSSWLRYRGIRNCYCLNCV